MLTAAGRPSRARRELTCNVCGKRFIAQKKGLAIPANCPECGHQRPRAGSVRRRLALGFWITLAVIALDIVLMTCAGFDGISSPPRSQVKFTSLPCRSR